MSLGVLLVEKIVKIIVLSSGKTLISEVVEFDPDELGSPDWKLISPHEILEGHNLKPWLKDDTDQTEFLIVSDNVFTVIEPKKSLVEKYLEKTN